MTYILIFGIINLILSFVSFFKIGKNLKNVDFIWLWGFVVGAFVWEDMLVFGFLQFGFALVSYILNDINIWITCFLIFWLVRSAGETLYFFLEQFIEPKQNLHYISSHFIIFRKVFGNISDQKCFIIMQVTMQSITIVCLILLIFMINK